MTVALAAIVGDDTEALARCLDSAAELVCAVYLVASEDAYEVGRVARSVLEHRIAEAELELVVVPRPFDNYGRARTAALELAASGSHLWTLMLDADMTVSWVEELESWLAADPYPEVGAWLVTVLELELAYRLPLLTRRTAPACYRGAAHEYLEHGGAGRALLGITVTHHADGKHRDGKLERDLELLRGGLVAQEPRAVYYSAQAYRDLGDTERAIALYRLRSELGGWEEERWHALYQAAKLAGDVELLLAAWRARPWRHEPLRAAAELVYADERAQDDTLFLER